VAPTILRAIASGPPPVFGKRFFSQMGGGYILDFTSRALADCVVESTNRNIKTQT